ncbi:sensor histidine kinase [Ligilactobacillus pabuli]|nr:ATP-binding protein [Ligilactobacillus pabuli]
MKVNQIIRRLGLGVLAVGLILIVAAQVTGHSLKATAVELHAGWLVATVLVVVSLLVLLEFFEQRRQRQILALLAKKLREVTAGQKSGHVLVPKNSELSQLASAVNQVQSTNTLLLKAYDRQKRGYFGLLEYVPIGVMVIDQDREIYLSNHYLSDIMERELELQHELYYTTLAEFDLVKLVEETFRTKQDQQAEVRLSLASGLKIVAVNVVHIPVSTHHFFVMLLVNDITEQKQIERMQLDFVSNVSHELKTPVTSIVGFSETLKNGALDEPETAAKFVEIIYQQSQKLTELINDILSLSRLDSGLVVEHQTIHLAQVVDQALQPYSQLIAQRQLTVKNQVSADFLVVTDVKKLRYILSNLLQNGIRYNQVGGQLRIKAHKKADKWELTVSDTGIGLTSEQQGRIFERFYRADTSRSKEVDGTGLGLAIVKEYVEFLGGKITVTSQLQVGTTFTVSLPVKHAKD